MECYHLLVDSGHCDNSQGAFILKGLERTCGSGIRRFEY